MARFLTTFYFCCTAMLLAGCAQRPEESVQAEESQRSEGSQRVEGAQPLNESPQVETPERFRSPQRASAEEKHYMIVFASQTEPSRARTAHTFATFVKTTGEPDAVGKPSLESHTISWLPASRTIALANLPERGKNLELNETLLWAQTMNARIIAWGPFAIKKEFFDGALRQIERLKSGAVTYKAVDGLLLRGGAVTNCIHAVSDIDTESGLLATGTAFGDAASVLVVRHLERWIIQPEIVHPRIAERLAVSKHDIQYRNLARAEPAR